MTEESNANSKTNIIGKTKTGLIIYSGPKGGHYHFTSGDHKSYGKKSNKIYTSK